MNNWESLSSKQTITCHGSDDYQKQYLAEKRADEMAWNLVMPAFEYIVKHFADTPSQPSHKPGR
eukprot:5816173-Pleurochrysis_carterae.AAC.1